MSKIIDESLEFSRKQALLMYDVMTGIDDLLPDTARGGKFITTKPSGWTSGFFPGTLWCLYENFGDEDLKHAAEAMTDRLEAQQFNTNTHDIGFIMNCSYGNGLRLTGREAYRQILINSGKSLATRFNPTVGCTRSWSPKPSKGWDFTVIVDNMMNLELLTVASALEGDNALYDIAKTHANTTMKNHFRSDYSSYHVVNYDEATGRILSRQTAQGLSDDSSWARGQGWGLYGFTMMYRQTGCKSYLDHAVNVANYIVNHPNTPKDKVPYWDFNAPAGKDTPRDASAAGLIASALIELSTYVEDDGLSSKYLKRAEDIIVSLSSKQYRAALGDNFNFIIKHATIHKPNNNFDTPVSYADYYFIEAMMRYKRLLQGRPVVDVITAFSENPDRAVWLSTLDHVARPVLANLAAGTLKANMPIETVSGDVEKRAECTHLEALGRVMVGIAPWLELGPDNTPEGRLRAEYIDLCLKAIANAVDPDSPDHLNFNDGSQPLVDAAFLAQGLLRAPTQVFAKLDPVTRERLKAELISSRAIKPWENNWLLFSAAVEAALFEFYGEWDRQRVDYALDKFMDGWYKGDGWYGDGPDLHIDYYNSFVIQPMMMSVLDVLRKHGGNDADKYDLAASRYSRYAEILERLISPDGTYPCVGRSIAYRFGAFHALSDAAYRDVLPQTMDPAQVRCALTAVIDRQMSAPGTFDGNGWLNVGFCGHQLHLGETYISTGSLYLCTAGFVALGLPETAPFWSRPAVPWSGKKAWGGADMPADHAMKR